MDDLNDHRNKPMESSTHKESHSPVSTSPSDDLMGLDFNSSTPTTVTTETGNDCDTKPIEVDVVSTAVNSDDDSFGDFGTATTITVSGEKNDDNDFGNFGTTNLQVSSVEVAVDGDNSNDDDDGFGDFGTAPTAGSNDPFAATGDDDDGFGDFGEVQAASDGDDDFGDFNDFGDDGFQNSDDFGEFGGSGDINGDDDAFGATSSPSQAEFAAPVPPPAASEPIETAPDFNAVNSRQVEKYVLDKLSVLYPYDESTESKELLNADLNTMDDTTVLSNQELWTSLCEASVQNVNKPVNRSNTQAQSPASTVDFTSAAPQFQWKYSNLRREYYASLGLVVAKEQNPALVFSNSVTQSTTSPSASKTKVSSSLIMNAEAISERKPLDIAAVSAYCQFTRESLGSYSGDEMKDIIAKLTELTRQASDELTYWLDQREQMIMDNERYNEMIGSLVGRAAKLKDAESKQKTNTKRGITRNSFHIGSR
ncbi:hypothetical protein FBU30_001897 [Linnemannia zychae]|nr:hypothetical protein FBU30_001897 [Linnemannia zychae]